MSLLRPRVSKGRSYTAGLAVTTIGIALFVLTVRRAGFQAILDGLGRAGGWFLLILVLSGIRHIARGVAWAWSVDPPAHLPVRDACVAHVAGHALGNLTPLGVAISEPTKVLWVRDRVSLVAGGAALTIENLVYSASVLPIFIVGTVALPVALQTTATITWVSVAMLVASAAGVGAAFYAVARKWRFLSGTLTWIAARGLFPHVISTRMLAAREAEDLIHRFTAGGAGRLLSIAAVEAVYQASAIAEVYVTLIALGFHVSFLTTFILEYVNRVITVAFKFMPMRLGVDEAGTGLAAGLLGLGSTAGVTLAVVRKGRVLCWSIVGLVFLAWGGAAKRASARGATTPQSEARAGE